MQPNLYLFFDGSCFEAMTLYAETLDGRIGGVVRNSDAPSPEERMPGGDEVVMHMNMKVGDLTVMASDAPAGMYDAPIGFRVQLEPESIEEFDRIHAALSEGARHVDMPVGEMFFAERFTMFTDRFGTPWMMSYEGNKAQGI